MPISIDRHVLCGLSAARHLDCSSIVMLRSAAVSAIGVYQRYVSPHKGYCCAYRTLTGICPAQSSDAVPSTGWGSRRVFACSSVGSRHVPQLPKKSRTMHASQDPASRPALFHGLRSRTHAPPAVQALVLGPEAMRVLRACWPQDRFHERSAYCRPAGAGISRPSTVGVVTGCAVTDGSTGAGAGDATGLRAGAGAGVAAGAGATALPSPS